MQDLLLEEDSAEMTEQRIDVNMLSRIDAEQKSTAFRVDDLDKSLQSLSREISEVKGAIKSTETPAWIKHYVLPCCVIISAAMVGGVIRLMVQMNGVEHFLRDNAGFIAGLRLQQSATDPGSPQHIAEAEQVLKSARRNKIAIPLDVVENAGKKFVEVSSNNTAAWNAALSFADYRSLLNVAEAPKLEGGKPYEPDMHIQAYVRGPKNLTGGEIARSMKISVFGELVTEKFAVMEQLSLPLHATKGYHFIGFQSLISGTQLILDGLHLRNVIVENMNVGYFGGALELENVYFVNCTFEFSTKPQTLDLARAVLSSPTITFVSLG
jgi:hypothetical protein